MSIEHAMTIDQPIRMSGSQSTTLQQREHDLALRIAQFEQQRQQWDLERQHLLTDIQQQASQLRDAWLRLENERRDLMKAARPTAADARPIRTRPVATTAEQQLDASDVINTQTLPNGSESPSPTEQFHLLRQHVFASPGADENIGSNRKTGETS
jgi:hypothetical protein